MSDVCQMWGPCGTTLASSGWYLQPAMHNLCNSGLWTNQLRKHAIVDAGEWTAKERYPQVFLAVWETAAGAEADLQWHEWHWDIGWLGGQIQHIQGEFSGKTLADFCRCPSGYPWDHCGNVRWSTCFDPCSFGLQQMGGIRPFNQTNHTCKLSSTKNMVL